MRTCFAALFILLPCLIYGEDQKQPISLAIAIVTAENHVTALDDTLDRTRYLVVKTTNGGKTPTEFIVKERFLAVQIFDKSGKEVPYTEAGKRFFQRPKEAESGGDRLESDHRSSYILGSGESKYFSINLSSYFDLTAPGNYKVNVKIKIFIGGNPIELSSTQTIKIIEEPNLLVTSFDPLSGPEQRTGQLPEKKSSDKKD